MNTGLGPNIALWVYPYPYPLVPTTSDFTGTDGYGYKKVVPQAPVRVRVAKNALPEGLNL